jgi:pyridoxal phosphate enzyme (YggS family)
MSSVTQRVHAVRERIQDACQRSGRKTDSVTLIGAAKRQPIKRLREALAAGLHDIGENRVQEGIEHQEAVTDGAVWHFIGPLQSNKVRRAVEHFDIFHAVDRLKIARKLDGEAGRRGVQVPAFLEVNLGGEESKHGFAPAGLADLVRPLADLDNLRIIGLMAIPPLAEDPEESRLWFRRLRELRDDLFGRREWSDGPGMLSMGMSGDFPVAIEEGATHVRVGTALFGPRD